MEFDFGKYAEMKAAGNAMLVRVGTDVYLAVDDGGARHKFIKLPPDLQPQRVELNRARQQAAARLQGYDLFLADVAALPGG